MDVFQDVGHTVEQLEQQQFYFVSNKQYSIQCYNLGDLAKKQFICLLLGLKNLTIMY